MISWKSKFNQLILEVKNIDATEELIEVLYNNFQNNNVIEYLNHKSKKIIDYPIITQNFMECSD